MNRVNISILLFTLSCHFAIAQKPVVSSGSIQRFEKFTSKYVDARNVDVWLPDNYNPAKKYDVVYMHDGQMLFDSAQTWNHKEWQADEVFGRLMKENKIEKCIVVGIWNNGKYRHSEYFPQKYLNTVTEEYKKEFSHIYLQDKPQSDNYLRFIVEELRPFINKTFSVNADKTGTFIMGSSMGGMISMYALSEYPQVFGGAACLSIAWVGRGEKNFELPLGAFNYLQKNAPSPFGHKIYMDHGTNEMDSMYGIYQKFVDVIMKEKGFSEGNYKSEVFNNTGHNETDWASRLHVPVTFLLGKTPEQKVSAGRIEKYPDFESKYVSERNVEVWLPENYDSKNRYAVLYMNDGQSLFDADVTWNHQSWDVDDVVTKLQRANKIKDVIVVAVWNGQNTRHADYFPQKPYERLTVTEKDTITAQLQRAARTKDVFKPVSDNYLRFLVSELKPFIDKTYPTYTDSKHTFIAGSSMGGLISMYAICEYPKVFGGAACLSTHWPGVFSIEGNPLPDAFLTYLSKHLPSPKNHKIYFDCGDQTLDALYPLVQQKADAIMKARGFTEKSWLTKYFPGDDHSEKSWNKRLHIPLLFLLGK